MDPTQTYLPAGSVPYSIHDINAFQAMSAEEQAAFIMGFADPAAAAYFLMVAGAKPEAIALIDPAYGGNKGVRYLGRSGKLYNSYEEMMAASDGPSGTVTIYPAGGGDPITVEQGTPIDVETVFGPGSGTSTVPQWQAPTAPAPITNPYSPTNGSTEGGVPVPSGTLTPTTTTPSGGGGGGTFIDATKPPTTKPSGGGGGTLPGDAETGPTVQAGAGSGALGLLAIAAIGLALFRRKR
jgi:hypothetical protein